MEQRLLSSFEKRFNDILSRFEEKIEKSHETAELARQRAVDNEARITRMNTEFLAMKEKIDQQQSALQKTIDTQSVQIPTLQALWSTKQIAIAGNR